MWVRSGLVSAWLGACAGLWVSGCSEDPRVPAGAGPVAPAEPLEPGWSAQVQSAIEAGEYAARASGDGYDVTNRAQGLRGHFDAGGLTVAPRSGGGADVGLSLVGFGREGAVVAVADVAPEEGDCRSDGAVDELGACVRQVRYARSGGLVEWWENRPDGLEQGFTVTARPGGEGPLVLALAVTGARVELDGDEARLVREAGDPLAYGPVAAWDERGRALEAWMEEAEGGLRLVVDDAEAEGTVTVDPLLSASAWTATSGQASASFGWAVSSAGDVNGDGYGDVVVGAPAYDEGETDEGRAYVYLGSASGLATTPAWTAASDQDSAQFGWSVASAGDVNGDGYGDVVVGAYAYDDGETDEGRAYVFLGSASGLATTAAWTAASDQDSAQFGWSVASAGDVDGDGYGDVVVGAYAYDGGQTNEGRAYVYLGSASGLSTSAAWTAESDQANALFGCSASSAGDVNGDGYGDVVVGAYGYDNGVTEEGKAYLYLGSASGLATSTAWTAESNQTSAQFGWSVSSAGDVNGDGYGDVAVGAYAYDNGAFDEGKAYLYLGSAAGLATTAAWTAESNQASASFGWSVSSAGDVDGDGFGDVVVGAFGYDLGATDEGQAYVYLGAASGLATTEAWTAEPDQSTAWFGWSVASAGDVNGDGYGDVVVGAYAYDDGEAAEGGAFLYLGSASGLATTAAWTAEGDQVSANFGGSVASAGDVNGDGYGDVVVGAHEYGNGEAAEGRAYLYLGSADGLSTSAAWTAESDQVLANFGRWVASAGDVNGDGYGDVVVGAPMYDGGELDEGRVYLYLGSASGLSTEAAWTAEPDQASAKFGEAVSSAGDVNGDGYGDVVVGADYYDDGQSEEGRAYVYLGSASGLSAAPAWTAESDQLYGYFGASVSSAGDVNGDGYGDVLVGAHGYDDGQVDEGRAFLYLGSASGLATTAAWTAEPDQMWARLGAAVSSAGDVNGDGYGDVVVGAYNYDNLLSDAGRAYVFLGSASGLGTTEAWTAESDQSHAYFGFAVSSAGDVNGDGYGDVVIGAYSHNNVELDEGRTFLYLGNGRDGTVPLARAPQARQPSGSTPIAAGLGSTATDRFDVHVGQARGAWGRARVALEIEAKPLGAGFDGTGLVRGAYVDAGLQGAALQQQLAGLLEATGYHWRARVVVSPAEGRPQGWGPWMYGGLSGDAHGGHVFTGWPRFYVDADQDGYGDPATELRALSAPEGYIADGSDCDDTSALVSPSAVEVCDGVDEDCDGTVDDDAAEAATWYADADADGFGDAGVATTACAQPAGFVADASDCDDTSALAFTGAVEACDGVDNDCDGAADEDEGADPVTWYADADGDGFGDAGVGATACAPPAGFVGDASDCDDMSALAYPGAVEVCDGADNDCDGTADEDAADAATWYADTDGDGFGDAGVGATACSQPAGFVGDASDCDDTSALAYTSAVEVCDGVDNDCDGATDDDDAADAANWYADLDGDGYGNAAAGATACNPPAGFVGNTMDCDDTSALAYLGAVEVCDEVDNDCDGTVDNDDAADAATWYADADADRFGDAGDATTACARPAGFVDDPSDCDDTSALVYPGALEVCDGVDNDCDGFDGGCDTALDTAGTGSTTGSTGPFETGLDTADTGSGPDTAAPTPTADTADTADEPTATSPTDPQPTEPEDEVAPAKSDEGQGCGCASTASQGAWLALLPALLAARSRRRRPARQAA